MRKKKESTGQPAESGKKRFSLNLTSGTRPSTNPWTKGQALSTKAIVIGSWSALLVWPLVLVGLTGGFTPTKPTKPTTTAQAVSASEQSAGATAQAFVASWLSATRANTGALADYVDLSGILLPEQGYEYRNLVVASVGARGSDGMVTVQVAAEIKEVSKAKDGKDVVLWPQRYFEVTLLVSQEGVKPRGLPRAVASPLLAPELDNGGYSQSLPAADPVAQSITSFLQAYLTDTGEIARYIAPGTDIAAVKPAPYTAVKPLQFKALKAPESSPAEGATIRTLTRTQLLGPQGQIVTADYYLALTARAGRWEVTSIENSDSSAATKSAKPTPTPTRK